MAVLTVSLPRTSLITSNDDHKKALVDSFLEQRIRQYITLRDSSSEAYWQTVCIIPDHADGSSMPDFLLLKSEEASFW